MGRRGKSESAAAGKDAAGKDTGSEGVEAEAAEENLESNDARRGNQ